MAYTLWAESWYSSTLKGIKSHSIVCFAFWSFNSCRKPWGRRPNKFFVDDTMKEKGTLALFWLTNDGAVHHHPTIFHISFKLFSNCYYLLIPFSVNIYVKCDYRNPENPF